MSSFWCGDCRLDLDKVFFTDKLKKGHLNFLCVLTLIFCLFYLLMTLQEYQTKSRLLEEEGNKALIFKLKILVPWQRRRWDGRVNFTHILNCVKTREYNAWRRRGHVKETIYTVFENCSENFTTNQSQKLTECFTNTVLHWARLIFSCYYCKHHVLYLTCNACNGVARVLQMTPQRSFRNRQNHLNGICCN